MLSQRADRSYRAGSGAEITTGTRHAGPTHNATSPRIVHQGGLDTWTIVEQRGQKAAFTPTIESTSARAHDSNMANTIPQDCTVKHVPRPRHSQVNLVVPVLDISSNIAYIQATPCAVLVHPESHYNALSAVDFYITRFALEDDSPRRLLGEFDSSNSPVKPDAIYTISVETQRISTVGYSWISTRVGRGVV